MNFVNKVKQIFSKHYAIERFGVMFSILSILMVLTVVSAFNTYVDKTKETMSAQAIYTQKFEMSLSAVSGNVENIYTNSNATKAFILLKFDDMTLLPTDANKYQIWLTGVNGDAKYTGMAIKPTASIYVMGSTGYVGVYLTETRGFDSQILYMVLRNNAQLSAVQSTKIGTATFAEFDQAAIYFNPGAQDAVVSTLLDADEISASALYEEFVSRPQEELVRKELSDVLMAMKIEFNRIDNYKAELSKLGVITPENLPVMINNDTLTAVRTSDGETVFDEFGNDLLFLNTEYIYPTGYHFNWQDGSVKNGYLASIAGNLSYDEYGHWLETHAKQKNEDGSFNLARLEWYKVSANGASQSFFVADYAKAVGTNGEIFVAATNLQKSWTVYEALKKSYQVSLLSKLVTFEYINMGIDLITTVNNSDDVITNW